MVSMEPVPTAGSGAIRPAANQAAATLERHLGYWLRLVSNEVSGTFERALEGRHISVAEWVALNQLLTGTGLTPARLAAAMGMTRGAVSKVLNKLESKKLIARSASSVDSRMQLLALTGHARRTLPGLTGIADRNDEHFFGVLSADEKASLRALLLKLAEAHRMAGIPIA